MTIMDIRRADERFATKIDWLDSKHSFSFGPHYDPANTNHGLLLVNNDDIVAPSSGFGTHPHRDMEIVSWVLSGELEHRDSEGNHGLILPGHAQRMSAGTGIRHSEHNPNPTDPVHFLQMWVPPDTDGLTPSYEQVDVSEQLAGGELVAVAAGPRTESAVTIHQDDAALYAVNLRAGATADLPTDRHVHVYVARGSGELDPGGSLSTGDAARVTEPDGLGFTAGSTGAEVLIWATG